MSDLPIADFALLSDCHGSALVAKNGTIAWLAMPRFDSGAAFSALLGEPEDGYWSLAPTARGARAERRYRGNSMVLETRWDTPTGTVRVLDALIILDGFVRRLVRRVEGITGSVTLESHFVPHFFYATAAPWIRVEDGRLHAIAGPDALTLHSPCVWASATDGPHGDWSCNFTVAAGEAVHFDLAWSPSHFPTPAPLEAAASLAATEAWWHAWSARGSYAGHHEAIVRRSLLTLKALSYSPTGAIVAAPTTSLPERPGGVRNWDYRFCWLRDATFTVLALLDAGYTEEVEQFVRWLIRAIAGKPGDLRILYGVSGERRIAEFELPHLRGYGGAKPVRIGNAASDQLQLDVYGEVVDAIYQAVLGGVRLHDATDEMLLEIIEFVRSLGYPTRDCGMWEIRGEPQYFTQSQVMVWAVLDRGISLVERGFIKTDASEWYADRELVRAQILERGFNSKLQSFVQAYESEAIDANLLLLPIVGFLPVDDPRIIGTIQAIEKRLLHFPFVKRYETSHPDNHDGLPPGEGAFLACSFWLCDVYAMQGRHDEAESLFDALVAHVNDVGLLAEEIDLQTGAFLGNFPQAFSHLALVGSAYNLASRTGPAHQRSRPDESQETA